MHWLCNRVDGQAGTMPACCLPPTRVAQPHKVLPVVQLGKLGPVLYLKTASNNVPPCPTGTSEMHFVAAIDAVGGLRPVLGLHETVCSGAAGKCGGRVGRGVSLALELAALELAALCGLKHQCLLPLLACRRLRAHGRQARAHAAAPGARPSQCSGQPAQCKEGWDSSGQPRG